MHDLSMFDSASTRYMRRMAGACNKNSRPRGGCPIEKWMEDCCFERRRGRQESWDLTTSSSRNNRDQVFGVIVPDNLAFIKQIFVGSNSTLVWGGHVINEILSKRKKRGTLSYSHSVEKSHILYFFSCFFPSIWYKNFKNTCWGQTVPIKK